MKRTVCRCLLVSVLFFFNATLSYALVGNIQLLNRWPMAGPNSVVVANIGGTDYVFVGDGEVVSVYDTTPALLYQFEVALSEKADLDKAGEVAGTEGVYGLFYADNYLYVACGNEGLQIFDVSDPLAVGKHESAYTPKDDIGRATVSGVSVAGSYAYITYFLITADGYDSGIQVLNVTDKTAPVWVGERMLPKAFAEIKRAVAINVAEVPTGSGDYYAFVTDLYNGLVIFDINKPAKPRVEAVCYFPYAYDVAVAEVPVGSGAYYAYVADDYAGLRIVSFDPTQFTDEEDLLYGEEGDIIPTCQYAGGESKALSVEVDPVSALAFVGDGNFGLVVIDVSNVNDINTVADDPDDPDDDPDLASNVQNYAKDMTATYSVCVNTSGTNPEVYLADTTKGVHRISVVEPTDWKSWEVVGVADTSTPADADAIFIDNTTNYTYMVDDDAANSGYSEGLRIFYNVISEEYITFLFKGKLPTSGEAKDVYFHEGYVYVADGSQGLKIIDPGHPKDSKFLSNPVLKGSCAVAGGIGEAMKVVVSGNYAYVAAGVGGLSIIDVSDKAAPKQKAALSGTDVLDARSVWVEGDYAYVADGDNGLKVVDVSKKSAPVLVGSVPCDGTAQALYLVRNRMYLGAGDAGFHVVDVQDPTSPVRYSGNSTYAVKGLFAATSDEDDQVDLIWVAAGKGGMAFFVYPPTVPPQFVAEFNSFGDAKGISVFGDFCFIADSAGGLLATTVTTQAGDPTDEGWDWLAEVKPTNLHATTYSSSSGCAVESLFQADEKPLGFLKGLFK